MLSIVVAWILVVRRTSIEVERTGGVRRRVFVLSAIGMAVLAISGSLTLGERARSRIERARLYASLGRASEWQHRLDMNLAETRRYLEGQWLRGLLSEAGYEVTGDTSSALVVAGHGATFHIWTSGLDEIRQAELAHEIERFENEGYERVGAIGDVPVFGDGVRLVWDSRQRRFWVTAGPTEADPLPSLGQLDPLVRASQLHLGRLMGGD